MDLNELRALMAENEGLRAAAKSPEARSLAGAADQERLRAALGSRDPEALREAVKGLLESPEGRRLAQQVSEAIKDHG